MRDMCADFGVELRELNGETDHVHLLVHYPPTVALSNLVNSLNGVSARYLWQEHGASLSCYLCGKHLWSLLYFTDSCGGAPLGAVKEYIESQNGQRSGHNGRAGQVRHEIQTNTTIINERWCDLVAAYDFEIGVSIDGPGMLNRNRLDRAGHATTARTIRGTRVLAEAGLPYSVICVVTPETIDHADDLVEFFSVLTGCESVGFNIEEQEGAARTPRESALVMPRIPTTSAVDGRRYRDAGCSSPFMTPMDVW